MKTHMVKYFLLTFLILTFLKGQITYESTDYSENGEIYNIINATSPATYDFTATGSNYTWSFDSFYDTEPETYGYENPINSPFKNTWCLFHFYLFNCNDMFNENFNMGLNLNQSLQIGTYNLSNVYQHLYKTSNELQLKMYGANVDLEGTNLPAILEYTDPDVLFKFPMNYNDEFSDENNIQMDFNSVGYDFVINSNGTRTNLVEGWGNLSIRNHVYENVLKVKSTLHQNFQITYQGQPNEFQANTVSYFWFDKDYGIPVLMVNGTEVGGVFIPSLVTYIVQEDMKTTEVESTQAVIYPNPTTGKINLKLKGNEQIKSVQIINQSGQIVGNKLDVSHLTKGIYQLKIQTTKKLISEKILKK